MDDVKKMEALYNSLPRELRNSIYTSLKARDPRIIELPVFGDIRIITKYNEAVRLGYILDESTEAQLDKKKIDEKIKNLINVEAFL